MPTTKGRNTHQRSTAAICRKARSRKREQFHRSASARSSSLSSSELSSKLEETFISSLYSTTDSSFSNTVLHQSFTSQQKLLSYEKRKNHAIADCDDMNFYQVIHNTFLLELLKNTICIQCREPWDGKMYISKREGLYCSLGFTCKNCDNIIRINTSKVVPSTKHHDINIRVQLGGHLAGIGRAGIVKVFGAMNVAPPVDEEHYEEIDKTLLLPCIKELQNQSMQAAIYEAVDENDGDPTALTVSGDGTWQTRGFKSIHGIAAILSASRTPKVLDVERLSKKCLVCTGALSIKKQNPDLYHEIIHNHDCESNYDGSSGGMESQGIQNLFQRSFSKYNVQYTRYIGDGDSKVMWHLIQNPPYPGIKIEKIEDINHWSKRMHYRLEKLTEDLRETMLDPEKKRKGIGGIHRLTKEMMIKFTFYYAKVIREYKDDLDMMHKRTWAIYKHKASTNDEPDHEWCGDWCGYRKSLLTGVTYDHQKHSLPRYVMEAIKPVFDDLASKEALQHVLNGSSQNANESFHAFIWNMAPKNKFCSGTTIDISVGLAVMIYNDGYLSIGEALYQVLDELGHFSFIAFDRMNKQRLKTEARWRKRREQQTGDNENMSNDNDSDEDHDDDAVEDYQAGAY